MYKLMKLEEKKEIYICIIQLYKRYNHNYYDKNIFLIKINKFK